MADCIFCKIIEGKISCEKVYEDKYVIAFLDVSPANKGHTLVIPKLHCRDIFEIAPESFAATMKTVQKIARALNKYGKGVNVISNNGSVAGQFVFHFHVHVIPRFPNDGFKLSHKRISYGEGEAKKIAGEIKQLIR